MGMLTTHCWPLTTYCILLTQDDLKVQMLNAILKMMIATGSEALYGGLAEPQEQKRALQLAVQWAQHDQAQLLRTEYTLPTALHF